MAWCLKITNPSWWNWTIDVCAPVAGNDDVWWWWWWWWWWNSSRCTMDCGWWWWTAKAKVCSCCGGGQANQNPLKKSAPLKNGSGNWACNTGSIESILLCRVLGEFQQRFCMSARRQPALFQMSGLDAGSKGYYSQQKTYKKARCENQSLHFLYGVMRWFTALPVKNAHPPKIQFLEAANEWKWWVPSLKVFFFRATWLQGFSEIAFCGVTRESSERRVE